MQPMRKTISLIITIFSLIAVFLIPIETIQAAVPSSYDLVTAVNDLRANNGLSALVTDGSLMAAAQGQADYLASIGPNIGNGHEGPGGNRAVDRAIAAGYPVVQGVQIIECWAQTLSSTSLETVIYSIWNDPDHMGVMLHQYGVHVGAGVAEADGKIYYILNVATVWGSSNGSGTALPTSDLTPKVVPVDVATPQPDGSIIHVVQPGQALWSIAIAYGVTVEQIRLLNSLPDNAIIYEGQELLIRMASTATPTHTITPTPRQSTRTPIPPRTPDAVTTPTPAGMGSSLLGDIDRQTLGLVLILVCGAGLALVLLGTFRKGKE